MQRLKRRIEVEKRAAEQEEMDHTCLMKEQCAKLQDFFFKSHQSPPIPNASQTTGGEAATSLLRSVPNPTIPTGGKFPTTFSYAFWALESPFYHLPTSLPYFLPC